VRVRPQLTPITSTPNAASSFGRLGRLNSHHRPPVGIETERDQHRQCGGLASAFHRAMASLRSLIVSIKIASAPPSAKAPACSAKTFTGLGFAGVRVRFQQRAG